MEQVQATIRRRAAEDYDGCTRVLRAVFATSDYPSRWPQDPVAWLNPDGIRAAWVAGGQNGEILGHIAVYEHREDPKIAMVTRLFVDPQVRGQGLGLGAELLRATQRWAKEQHLELQLDVVQTSTPAVNLYEREGWQYLRLQQADWIDRSGRHPMMRIYAAPTA
ncbi:GNAT family N-acetyltransferase [Glutamicibacter uratoxydans]|uniref:GNAT family N-acetyltransferase n=1 Tax=Glutamicibacter uratoxydans TaxID=43667 RepID=A0A4Y4DRW9_GLUUR|nr:GNAT family N-acetyltransferase [Glutamicibacter uratoxydans]GED05251.1 GNAT family N-acetyltransferase [Glutamicibacter uratoxydans]